MQVVMWIMFVPPSLPCDVQSPVHVLLVRRGEPVSLSLTPRRWHGLGLLGSAIFLSLSDLSLSLSSLQVCDCTFITSSQQNLLS